MRRRNLFAAVAVLFGRPAAVAPLLVSTEAELHAAFAAGYRSFIVREAILVTRPLPAAALNFYWAR